MRQGCTSASRPQTSPLIFHPLLLAPSLSPPPPLLSPYQPTIASLSAEKWKLEGCASPAFTYYILPPVTFELQRLAKRRVPRVRSVFRGLCAGHVFDSPCPLSHLVGALCASFQCPACTSRRPEAVRHGASEWQLPCRDMRAEGLIMMHFCLTLLRSQCR